MKPCISNDLRQMLLLLKDNPEAVIAVLRAAESCDETPAEKPTLETRSYGKHEPAFGEPEEAKVPTEMFNVSPEERQNIIRHNIADIQALITEGAPPELYRKLNETFLELGQFASDPVVKYARKLFQDVQVVTQNVYYKSEGKALSDRLTELNTLLEGNCDKQGCMLPQPRPQPLTISERLQKLGLKKG